ncbi:hypothetical protein KUTeg_007939 [Tegillarca granosa]|uniref:Uncharacterized protein n=1 Tax=Tegillarca granosa TaxID=220873 RepID=A0ABQ9FEN5_TEGGR|nr:hypothetical protein KUTeg_007939 [Tegillarca granosa]
MLLKVLNLSINLLNFTKRLFYLISVCVFLYIFAPQQGYVYNICRVKQVFVSLTTDFRYLQLKVHNFKQFTIKRS